MEPLIDEIEDFDLKPATYAVTLLIFDKDGECLDAKVLSIYEDPDKAIDQAKKKAMELAKLYSATPDLRWEGEEVYGAMVTVETIIDYEEASEAGTLFKDTIYVKPVQN